MLKHLGRIRLERSSAIENITREPAGNKDEVCIIFPAPFSAVLQWIVRNREYRSSHISVPSLCTILTLDRQFLAYLYLFTTTPSPCEITQKNRKQVENGSNLTCNK